MPTEYSFEAIEAACGVESANYASNKNRGGRNSANGRDFELCYATVRICELAAEVLRNGCDGADIVLNDQLFCFVDDLMIRTPSSQSLSQLKSGAASWEAGERSIATDFRLQRVLDNSLGIKSQYELVVGSREKERALLAQKPDDIDANIRFHAGDDFDSILMNHPDLGRDLDCISIRPPLKRSVREQTFMVLLGAWITSAGATSLRDVVNRASTGPDALIGPIGESYALPKNVEYILSKIPGLTFEVRRNHLYFECYGMSGYAAFNCFAPDFRILERRIVELEPNTFRDLHPILRGQA